MKLRYIYEGYQHPAVLQSLKDEVAAGKVSHRKLAHTYSISRQRVGQLANKLKRRQHQIGK